VSSISVTVVPPSPLSVASLVTPNILVNAPNSHPHDLPICAAHLHELFRRGLGSVLGSFYLDAMYIGMTRELYLSMM
jgi:hypothetical protein